MAIMIKDLKFDGPVKSTDGLEEKPGIYAILYTSDKKYFIVDVGESDTVKTRIENHDRKNCWKEKFQGEFLYAALYTPDKDQTARNDIAGQIRSFYKVPCGKK